nr:MAG TPA: hypothetical protein [Caudoviricetes sp.]
MTNVIKSKATIAAVLIKAVQVNGYDYEQQKVLLDKLAICAQEAIDKYGVVFYFADYSAIACNDLTKSLTEFYGANRDFAEIALRIQNFRGCAADCPAYLRSDILSWLRENDIE